jgi:hypothetical protein
LLHECTQAIVDIEKIEVRRLYGEVAAYVAQNTYLLLYNPNIREYSEESSPPGTIEAVYRIAREIVRNYELNGRKGYGAHISGQDIDELAHLINYVPGSYADIAWDESHFRRNWN